MFLYFVGVVTAQVIPSDDLVYIYLQQEFRINNNLKYFLWSYPYDSNKIITTKYSPPKKDAIIRLLPNIRAWGYNPVSIIKGWGSGRYEKWSLLIEPVVVPEEYGEEILGTSFTRFNLSGRFMTSFLRYTTDLMQFQIGRGPVWWGQSWESSIIQSGKIPPFDHVDLRINFGQFQLELLAGQLGSEYTKEANRIKRNIAGHRLTWIPNHNRWLLGLGEQIIYTGINRGIEWFYLNPAIPYVFSAFEKEEETVESGLDNDNSIIFLYGRYVFKPNLSTYFEFILDDYQIDKNNTPNALGWKIGLDGGTTLLNRSFTYETEITRIDSWTYIHSGEFTSWQNLSHPIGFNYGPDSWSVMLLGDYWLKNDILLLLKYTFLEKGKNNLETKWNSPGTKGAPFPLSPTTIYNLTEFSLSWYAKYGILEIGYTNFPVGNAEINGEIDKLQGTLFFNVQLVWGFGFDLE